jgi:hypothetical protein
VIRESDALAIFSRLEYGKICVASAGPILKGEELRVIATAGLWPPAAADLCDIQHLSLGDQPAAARIVDRNGHGTVLRPLVANGTIGQIAYRYRHRPERGEGEAGRRYWLARYLYCETAWPTDVGLRALDAFPLIGLPQNARVEVVAVAVTAAPLPEPPVHFLPQAIAYCMSGIPVGVAASLNEPAFFALAESLRAALPSMLQKLFSCGWSVAPDLTDQLHCSLAESFGERVAVFDPLTSRWTAPRAAPAYAARGAATFQSTDLVPGRMYLSEVFPQVDGLPQLGGGPTQLPQLGTIDDIDASQLPALPGPHAPVVAAAFRRIGNRALDRARLSEVERWIEGGPVDQSRLCVAANDYFSADFRERLVRVGLTALGTPGREAAGDRIIWETAVGRRAGVLALPLQSEQAGVRRARLLAAIAARDSAAAVARLRDYALAEESVPLPPGADKKLDEHLSQTIENLEALDVHRDFFQRAEEKLYAPWLKRHLGKALLAVSSVHRQEADELASRINLSGAASVVALAARFARRMEPSPADEAVFAADARLRPFFERVVRRAWEQTAGPGRSHLIEWVRFIGTTPQDDPVWQLAAKRDPLKFRDGDEIARILDPRTVPSSLSLAAAQLVYNQWESFGPMVHRVPSDWTRITDQFPDHTRNLLLVQPPAGASRTHSTQRLPALSTRQLDRLLGAWCAAELPDSIVAESLEEIFVRANPAPAYARALAPSAFAVCVSLIEHQDWRDVDIALGAVPADEIVDLAAEILRKRDRRPSPNVIADLWRRTTRGWHIRFMLQRFTRHTFEPTLAQLSMLIRHRQWLRRHLTVHQSRRAAFGIAAQDFYELDFDGNGSNVWREEYRKTPLWAAFASVPMSMQGSLYEAAAAYTNGMPAAIVAFGHDYLSAERSHPHEGARRVHDSLLRPLLSRTIDDAARAIWVAYGFPVERPFASYMSFGKAAPVPVVVEPHRTAEAMIAVQGGTVYIAPELARLLQRVIDGLRTPARKGSW